MGSKARLSLPTVLFPHDPVFKCWVSVDGSPTPVYGTSTKDRTTSAFIEASEGSSFKVHLINGQWAPQHGLLQQLVIDGKSCGSTVQVQAHRSYFEARGSLKRLSVFSGRRTSASSMRPFEFQPTTVTQDLSIAMSDETSLDNLGTIQLKLYRVTNVRKYDHAVPVTYHDIPDEIVLHEDSKKVSRSHQTRFGAPQAATPLESYLTHDWIDPYTLPYHTFEFRYISRELLEITDLIKVPQPARNPIISFVLTASPTKPTNFKPRPASAFAPDPYKSVLYKRSHELPEMFTKRASRVKDDPDAPAGSDDVKDESDSDEKIFEPARKRMKLDGLKKGTLALEKKSEDRRTSRELGDPKLEVRGQGEQ